MQNNNKPPNELEKETNDWIISEDWTYSDSAETISQCYEISKTRSQTSMTATILYKLGDVDIESQSSSDVRRMPPQSQRPSFNSGSEIEVVTRPCSHTCCINTE